MLKSSSVLFISTPIENANSKEYALILDLNNV